MWREKHTTVPALRCQSQSQRYCQEGGLKTDSSESLPKEQASHATECEVQPQGHLKTKKLVNMKGNWEEIQIPAKLQTSYYTGQNKETEGIRQPG